MLTISTYPRACCSRFHFCSIVPGVRLFKLLSNDEELCSWDDDKHLKWERSRVSSSHDTVIPKTKTMTKIANIIRAPVVGVLGNCDKETWTMNWNKLGTDLFSSHCFLTISLSFHNLCSSWTVHAQRIKFQRNYSLGYHLVVYVGKKCTAEEVNLNGNDSVSVAFASYLPYLYMCLHCLQFVSAHHNIYKSDKKEMSLSCCI